MRRPGSQSPLKFIPKVFYQVEVVSDSVQASQVLSHLPHPCLYGPCFVNWCADMLEHEGAIPKTVSTKLGA